MPEQNASGNEFNFTIGSRWQSKGAGVGIVKRMPNRRYSTVGIEFSDDYWTYNIDGSPEKDNVFDKPVPEEYHLTGPAEPTPPIEDTPVTGDRQAFWDRAVCCSAQGFAATGEFDGRTLEVAETIADLAVALADALCMERDKRIEGKRS